MGGKLHTSICYRVSLIATPKSQEIGVALKELSQGAWYISAAPIWISSARPGTPYRVWGNPVDDILVRFVLPEWGWYLEKLYDNDCSRRNCVSRAILKIREFETPTYTYIIHWNVIIITKAGYWIYPASSISHIPNPSPPTDCGCGIFGGWRIHAVCGY